VLGCLETEELFLLSGCKVAGDEAIVASCLADAEMLESFDSAEYVGWLRRSHCVLGTMDDVARDDHAKFSGA
jgi:hypothetical protein